MRLLGAAAGNAQVIQAGRDVHVSAGRPGYRFASLPVAPPPLSPGDARRQPSRLLDARRRVVAFTGRAAELSGLVTWLDGPERAAARLINGPGGQGKTRLAQHLAQLSADTGWQVRIAYPGDHAFGRDATGGAPRGDDAGQVLIVVDYAERWALDHLLSMVGEVMSGGRSRFRFLLLARPMGLWWYGLSRRLEDNLGLTADAMELPVLAASLDERLAAFVRARDCFAEALGVPDANAVHPPRALDGDAYGVALTTHMAALTALDAHIHADVAPEDPGRLSEYLLGRELVHWQDMHGRGGELPVIDAHTMGRTVLAASLTGPHIHAEGAALIERAGLASDPVAVERIMDAHAVCYPAPDQATVLEPLYPDRLAEDYIALLTPGHPHAYPADAWTVTALRRLLCDGDNDDAIPSLPYAKQALTILIETAARWEHVARVQLYPLLRGQPRLVLAAGGAALVALARLPHLDPAVLEALEPHLPSHNVDLDIGIAALTERLTEHRLASTPDNAKQAQLHLALGIRQGVAGFNDRAADSLQQAVVLFRQLPARQAVAARPHLAEALLNLGISRLHEEQHTAAVTALQEAVSLYQQALPTEPIASGEGLATSLDMLEVALSRSGERREALELARIVAGAWGSHPRQEPESRAKHARALLNLGNRLSEENEAASARQAMTATKKAVGIFRRLTADDPGAYSPDLARALMNWSDDLVTAGREEEALAAATEGVALYRAMTEVNSAAFQADYGRALVSLGVLLGKVRRYREAYDATSEALAIFRAGRTDGPALKPALTALALTALATLLVDLGNPGEAAARAREAVALCHGLGSAGSVTDHYRIAGAMGALAGKLGLQRKWDEALEAADVCAHMFRRVAVADPSFAKDASMAARIPDLLRAARTDPRLYALMGEMSLERPDRQAVRPPAAKRKGRAGKKRKRKK